MLSSQVDPLARESQGAGAMLVGCCQMLEHRKLNTSPGYFEIMGSLSKPTKDMIHLKEFHRLILLRSPLG